MPPSSPARIPGTMNLRRLPGFLLLALLAAAPALAASGEPQPQTGEPAAAPTPFFRIQVLDRATQRGVPMVELKMTNGAKYYTDSAGVVAFYEPGLMGREVWFHVWSHGYEHPADYFGYRGVKLVPTQGGRATVLVDRVNLAERLYRITGLGIYRDTRLLGEPTPTAKPVVNGLVAGQDSALATIHGGRIHWFWGDTGRPAYPLGNFKTAGATSLLPGQGGLDPAVGVDLEYWVDANGFAREMAPVPGSGVVWLGGLATAPDSNGVERMFAQFTRLQGLGSPTEQGLVVWNEATETFEKASVMPLDDPRHPEGAAPFAHTVNGVEYLYFGNPYPNLRVPRVFELIDQPDQFEGYTPLVAGTRFQGAQTQLDRDAHGQLVWAWKAATPPITVDQQRELINANLMTRGESPYRMTDFDTGQGIHVHNGTVAWNDYRQKWVMVFGQSWGSSMLGEIYVAEAPAIEGPWVRGKKVVTHEDYSFYNVAHRSFFDQDGGRTIYFEGTYTKSFSGAEVETPRYDYNQVMYRLDLSDPRLFQR